MINIEPFEMRQFLKELSDYIVTSYRVAEGKEKPFLSLRGSYKLYGKSNVDSWINKGIVQKRKDGQKNSTVRLDRLELERASKTSNRYEREYKEQSI